MYIHDVCRVYTVLCAIEWILFIATSFILPFHVSSAFYRAVIKYCVHVIGSMYICLYVGVYKEPYNNLRASICEFWASSLAHISSHQSIAATRSVYVCAWSCSALKPNKWRKNKLYKRKEKSSMPKNLQRHNSCPTKRC